MDRSHSQIAFSLGIGSPQALPDVGKSRVEGVKGQWRIQEAGNQPRSTQAQAHLVASLCQVPSLLPRAPLRWSVTAHVDGAAGACGRRRRAPLPDLWPPRSLIPPGRFRMEGEPPAHPLLVPTPALPPAARPVVSAALHAPPSPSMDTGTWTIWWPGTWWRSAMQQALGWRVQTGPWGSF